MTTDMMMGERDLEAELKEKDEIIMSLRLNEHLLNDKLEISRRNMKKQLERITALEKENEQLKQKIQRWKNLYELKDAEVTARVDTLNRVCNYYLTEAQFKAETDPNDAVKEVINEILNAPIYEE